MQVFMDAVWLQERSASDEPMVPTQNAKNTSCFVLRPSLAKVRYKREGNTCGPGERAVERQTEKTFFLHR